MKAYTRQQVIDIWERMTEETKNLFTCPNCRDILTKDRDVLRCTNNDCCFTGIFSIDGEWLEPRD